ncbi:MAG: alpha/beta fold hydrolase, partial [Phycisphaerales bacterium]|nr:alpha/beta fold hydrolase [Phycisphaerales bacterium]
ATLEPWPDLVERMVLYDLRGHGESSGPSRVGIGEEDDLAALLDELGPGPFVLVGRSLGGGIAWRQAARDERVAGLLLLAPVLDLRDATRRRLVRAGYPTWPIVPLAFAWLRLRGLSVAESPAGRAVAAPVLVVTGADDEITPPATTASCASAGPHIERVLIVGAGHADLETVDPDRLDGAIRSFVDRVRAGVGDGSG